MYSTRELITFVIQFFLQHQFTTEKYRKHTVFLHNTKGEVTNPLLFSTGVQPAPLLLPHSTVTVAQLSTLYQQITGMQDAVRLDCTGLPLLDTPDPDSQGADYGLQMTMHFGYPYP